MLTADSYNQTAALLKLPPKKLTADS